MNEINILEILGKNMHDIRFEKKISLKDLSEKTHIDIGTLMKFEAGMPSGLWMPDYLKITESLGVAYNKLTKGIDFVE